MRPIFVRGQLNKNMILKKITKKKFKTILFFFIKLEKITSIYTSQSSSSDGSNSNIYANLQTIIRNIKNDLFVNSVIQFL
jgi:hypothetical protein